MHTVIVRHTPNSNQVFCHACLLCLFSWHWQYTRSHHGCRGAGLRSGVHVRGLQALRGACRRKSRSTRQAQRVRKGLALELHNRRSRPGEQLAKRPDYHASFTAEQRACFSCAARLNPLMMLVSPPLQPSSRLSLPPHVICFHTSHLKSRHTTSIVLSGWYKLRAW